MTCEWRTCTSSSARACHVSLMSCVPLHERVPAWRGVNAGCMTVTLPSRQVLIGLLGGDTGLWR